MSRPSSPRRFRVLLPLLIVAAYLIAPVSQVQAQGCIEYTVWNGSKPNGVNVQINGVVTFTGLSFRMVVLVLKRKKRWRRRVPVHRRCSSYRNISRRRRLTGPNSCVLSSFPLAKQFTNGARRLWGRNHVCLKRTVKLKVLRQSRHYATTYSGMVNSSHTGPKETTKSCCVLGVLR